MKKKHNYGALIVIPIQGMIIPAYIVPSDFLFVATEAGNLVVTASGNNVVAKDYVN